MEEIKREDIDKIIDDLGANYREEDRCIKRYIRGNKFYCL